MMLAWKSAACLAAGNTLVLKPAQVRHARPGAASTPPPPTDVRRQILFLEKKMGSYITPSFQISWASFHISWASFHISKYSFLIANKLGNPNFRMSMTMEAGLVYVNEIP